MGLILINLENIAVPSIHQGFVSAELCAALLHNEDTNLLPKTTLEKSTMKSSGILKEKSKTKQLGGFFVTTVIWPYLRKPQIYYRTQKMC